MSNGVDWMGNRTVNPPPIDPRSPAGGTGAGFSAAAGPQPAPKTVESHQVSSHVFDFTSMFKEADETVEHAVEIVGFTVDAGQRIVGKMAFKTDHFKFWAAEVIKNAKNDLRGVVQSAAMRKIYNGIVWAEDKLKGPEKRLFVIGLAAELNTKVDELKAIWNSGDGALDKAARTGMVVDAALLKTAAGTVTFGAHLGIQFMAWSSDHIGSTFHSDKARAFASNTRQEDQDIQKFVDEKFDGEYISSAIQKGVIDFMMVDVTPTGKRFPMEGQWYLPR